MLPSLSQQSIAEAREKDIFSTQSVFKKKSVLRIEKESERVGEKKERKKKRKQAKKNEDIFIDTGGLRFCEEA